jgi:lipoprotein-anchoring transpeptidase ErfK/SrfK
MRLLHIAIALPGILAAVLTPTRANAEPAIVVSVTDQTLAVVDGGAVKEKFRVSTSRFGLGDKPNSYATPVGSLEIASKIGGNAPLGTVFRSRQPTGEVLCPNAPGRDPIVTRILWLRGLERENSRAYSRNIYIHGTPVEKLIGRPVSYGCIRMRSQDVARLYNTVRVGTKIEITNTGLGKAVAQATLKQQARTMRIAAQQTRGSRLAAN